MWVYSKYIIRNGVRIYSKSGKVFRFWVDDEENTPCDGQLSLEEDK